MRVNDLTRGLDPPAGVAVTVTLNISGPVASYIPVITPVPELILSPLGRPEAE